VITTNRLHILLTGRSQQAAQMLATVLKEYSNTEVATRVISNGHFDPLYGLTSLPDVLILVLGPNYQEELGALESRPPALRPPTVVIGPEGDPEVMRLAMRAGARDFLTQPVSPEELQQTLHRIAQEKSADLGEHRTIAVLNAKGGSGATFIACNLAYILAAQKKAKTALLDLDIQFGAQALYLDLQPVHDIVEALKAVDELDALALEGYMAKHRSSLHLLAAPADRLVLYDEVPPQSLDRLLALSSQSYSRIVIDMPRLLDGLSIMALERAYAVVVVMQQSLASIRDAKRLTAIMQRELEIPKERIVAVINRFESKNPISADNIRQALGQISLAFIPNDYGRVQAAADQGIPLYESAPSAPITRAFIQLANRLAGELAVNRKEGLLRRAMLLLSGKST
jgi:pilus assembly protein CpaE